MARIWRRRGACDADRFGAELKLEHLPPGNAANGGVGQALFDLLRTHDVSTMGAAARTRREIVKPYRAIPIEGRSAPLEVGVRSIRAEGADARGDVR
ncbi:MAG: hypothetical protein ACRD3W_13535 [Terriglobales bacterium]